LYNLKFTTKGTDLQSYASRNNMKLFFPILIEASSITSISQWYYMSNKVYWILVTISSHDRMLQMLKNYSSSKKETFFTILQH